jgi:hypothetical protein
MWMFTLLALSRFVVAGLDNSSQAETCKSQRKRDDLILTISDCKLSPTHLSTIAFSRVTPYTQHSANVMQLRVIERVYKLGL